MSFASDVPVSLPEPLESAAEALLDMYGFALNRFGVRPALSAADHEHLAALTRPAADAPTVRADAHLDRR